jgi:hypothetical protein
VIWLGNGDGVHFQGGRGEQRLSDMGSCQLPQTARGLLKLAGKVHLCT